MSNSALLSFEERRGRSVVSCSMGCRLCQNSHLGKHLRNTQMFTKYHLSDAIYNEVEVSTGYAALGCVYRRDQH